MASTPSSSQTLRPSRSAAGADGSDGDKHDMQPYRQQPPHWRPSLLPKALPQDVPDLFPTKPDQPEDDMSQISVRKGFAGRAYVRNESFSAHEMIYDRLASRQTLSTLSQWFDEVLQRRQELHQDSIAPSQYKPPSRVTLNDVKLANYVKDLADPSVSLSRLSRTVPHGFRGEKLFEMLWAGGALPTSNATSSTHPSSRPPSLAQTPAASAQVVASSSTRRSVDVARAVWFIRALGAAELSSLRNKSAATIIPEITSNLCSWMAKQINELQLLQVPESSTTTAASPLTPSPSTAQPRTPGSLGRSAYFPRTPSHFYPTHLATSGTTKDICAVLQNEAEEERWIAKWSYSLSLARHLQAQQLLDRSVLIRWITDAFAAANIVQLPFLLELIQEVLVLILQRRCFVKPFLTALLHQIPSFDQRSERQAGAGLRKKLLRLFRVACETNPDTLASPRLWYEHAATIMQLLQESDAASDADEYTITAEYVERHIRPRAERLLLKKWSLRTGLSLDEQQSKASPTSLHKDIAALDSFDMKVIDAVFLQPLSPSGQKGKASIDDAAWTPRVETILTWACTDRRSGVARQYLAATLIEKIRFGVSWDESSEGSDNLSVRAYELEQYTKKTRKINVEPMLIKWLGDVEAALATLVPDTSTSANTPLLATVDVASIVILVGELARRGVFSYTKYLQRLIARGMTTTTTTSSQDKNSTEDDAETGHSAQPSKDSLHLRLLRSLPLYDQPASVHQQRKQAIYGDRTKETYEEAAERRALRVLKDYLPSVFSDGASEQGFLETPSSSVTSTFTFDKSALLHSKLNRLWTASRYVRCRIFRNELVPAALARADTLTGQDLCQIASILEIGEDFEALAQLLAALLLRPLSDSLARSTFNLIIDASDVWRSMDIMSTFNQLVRQQLNHSSSIRNDKQAVMASTTLLRLRSLMEGVPSRIAPGVGNELADNIIVLQHVAAARRNVDDLLAKLSGADQRTQEEAANQLARFRALFLQPDAMTDEIIERAIIDSVLERNDPAFVDVAARLIEQLYLEASLEIDERHARWLSHLAVRIDQSSASEVSIQPLPSLLLKLIAKGTLNLQVAMDEFLLPCLSSLVKRLTDPSVRSKEAIQMLLGFVNLLSTLLAARCGSEDRLSWEESRDLSAQATLLFGPTHLASLLKVITGLICCSEDEPSAEGSPKQVIETFWRSVLRSEYMQMAFRQDPRKYFLTLRDAVSSIWGGNPSRVSQIVMGCVDESSLLLRDIANIDASAIKARLDGWHTSTVAIELVEIFEQLQTVESNFQSRGDSRTKALAAGIFGDIFVLHPDLGPQFLRDCQAAGLVSKFADVGLKSLAEKVAKMVDSAKGGSAPVETRPKAHIDKKLVSTTASAEQGTPSPSQDRPPQWTPELKTVFGALLRMCEHQDSFNFSASDADSCVRILHYVVTNLEGVAKATEIDIGQKVSSLFREALTLDLLHLLLRFSCLWTNTMKNAATRLVKVMLQLARVAGAVPKLGTLFVALVDSCGYVIEELPSALLIACIPELEAQLQKGGVSTTERAEKLQKLSYTLESTASENGLITAFSADAALRRGWFVHGGPNPWECPEYLDAPPAMSSSGATATGGIGTRYGPGSRPPTKVDNVQRPGLPQLKDDGMHQQQPLPGARTGWPTRLTLNTAIPLSLLGIRVTRDLVPHYASPSSGSVTSIGSPAEVLGGSGIEAGEDADRDTEASIPLPSFLDSERSYGDHKAGEPLYARDIRRGLTLASPQLDRVLTNSTTEAAATSAALGSDTDNLTPTDKSAGTAAARTEAKTSSVGLSSDAIPVIDLTWDDDDPPEPLSAQSSQPRSLQHDAVMKQGRNRSDSLNSGGSLASNASTSKKRRLSKRF